MLSCWSSQIHGRWRGVLLGWFSGSRGEGTEPWGVAEASGEADAPACPRTRSARRTAEPCKGRGGFTLGQASSSRQDFTRRDYCSVPRGGPPGRHWGLNSRRETGRGATAKQKGPLPVPCPLPTPCQAPWHGLPWPLCPGPGHGGLCWLVWAEISPSAPAGGAHSGPLCGGVAHRGIAGPAAGGAGCPVRARRRPAGPSPPHLAWGCWGSFHIPW